MITADITIVAHGNGARTSVAHVVIVNDNTGTEDLGNYRWTVTNATLPATRKGRIERFRRSHPNGAAMLVAMVLRQAFPFQPDNKGARWPNKNMGEDEQL